jgi:hypothetical protein
MAEGTAKRQRYLKLARNSAAPFSWMPACAGMTSFPRKRESSLTSEYLPRKTGLFQRMNYAQSSNI